MFPQIRTRYCTEYYYAYWCDCGNKASYKSFKFIKLPISLGNSPLKLFDASLLKQRSPITSLVYPTLKRSLKMANPNLKKWKKKSILRKKSFTVSPDWLASLLLKECFLIVDYSQNLWKFQKISVNEQCNPYYQFCKNPKRIIARYKQFLKSWKVSKLRWKRPRQAIVGQRAALEVRSQP